MSRQCRSNLSAPSWAAVLNSLLSRGSVIKPGPCSINVGPPCGCCPCPWFKNASLTVPELIYKECISFLFTVQVKDVKIDGVLPFPRLVNTLTRSPYPPFDMNAAASYRGWRSGSARLQQGSLSIVACAPFMYES